MILVSRSPLSTVIDPCPKVSWGIDLATEHERFITEEIFRQPTIVYNYPKEIKAFYMKLNDDGKTVAAMDVLVPKVTSASYLFRHLISLKSTCFHVHFTSSLKTCPGA